MIDCVAQSPPAVQMETAASRSFRNFRKHRRFSNERGLSLQPILKLSITCNRSITTPYDPLQLFCQRQPFFVPGAPASIYSVALVAESGLLHAGQRGEFPLKICLRKSRTRGRVPSLLRFLPVCTLLQTAVVCSNTTRLQSCRTNCSKCRSNRQSRSETHRA